jgi:zinc-ribbon domain
MVKFCTSCGTANTPDARFCAKCGTGIIVKTDNPAPPVALVPPEPYPPITPSPVPERIEPTPVFYESTEIPTEEAQSRNWVVIGAVIGVLLVIGALYFWLFVADDMGGTSGGSYGNTVEAKEAVEQKQMFAMTEANIRDKPTTIGSTVLGKMPRGSAVTGVVKLGEDGISEWLELADGKGFIGVVNLSETQPPEISQTLNDKIWITDAAMEIWSQPDTGSDLVDRVSEGTKLTLSGLTANDFIEVKLRKGGVGYIAGGAAILKRLGGKPIAINFNPSSCNFGSEVEALFAQLNAQTEAKRLAIENAKYPSDEMRDAAIEKYEAAAEGRSNFMKLQRSFNGLTVTGIAQHYESQSVYFAEPAAQVIEAFRSLGVKIGKNGMFPEGDVYSAGIGASGNASYGKSDLGCGV